MTVKELIERLSNEDPNMRVVVDGYEDGYDEFNQLRFVKIKPNLKVKENYWEGEFEDWTVSNDESIETALCFPRKS